MTTTRPKPFWLVVRAGTALALATIVLPGCGGDSSGSGESVAGPVDTHCIVGGSKQAKPVGMCVAAATVGADHVHDAADAGVGDGGATEGEYGATLFNAEGDDDECKYHVRFTSAGAPSSGVTFTVHVDKLVAATPALAAGVEVEAFLDETHPAPASGTSTEIAAGTYRVGPVVFDKPGRWTVRFHLYESCSDVPEDTPHGHLAFYYDVK
jgi:hypothetical protein